MSELLRAVGRGVAETTEGLQHPTIDRDNLDARLRFPRVPSARWVDRP